MVCIVHYYVANVDPKDNNCSEYRAQEANRVVRTQESMLHVLKARITLIQYGKAPKLVNQASRLARTCSRLIPSERVKAIVLTIL